MQAEQTKQSKNQGQSVDFVCSPQYMNNLNSLSKWVNDLSETSRTFLSNAIVGTASFGVAATAYKATTLAASHAARFIGSASGAIALVKQGATVLAGATALARIVSRSAALLEKAPAAIHQIEAAASSFPLSREQQAQIHQVAQLAEVASQQVAQAAPIAAQVEKVSDQFNHTFGKTLASINPRTLTIAGLASAVLSIGPFRSVAALVGADLAGEEFAKELSTRSGLTHQKGSIDMGLLGGAATFALTRSPIKALAAAGTISGLSSVFVPNFFRDATETMNRWAQQA